MTEDNGEILGFIPATLEQVNKMDKVECTDYLDEIAGVLTTLRNRRREYLIQNKGREHHHYVCREIMRMNAERAKIVTYYRQVQKRLEMLSREKEQDVMRGCDNWLYLFHREAKKLLAPDVYRATVNAVSEIAPLPKRLMEATR